MKQGLARIAATIIFLLIVEMVDAVTFVPFGAGSGDQSIARGDDTYSALAYLPYPLQFMGTAVRTFSVGTNGLITFDGIADNFNGLGTKIPAIAPFMTDLDTSSSPGLVHFRLTTNTTTLRGVPAFLSLSWKPSHMLVATWDRVLTFASDPSIAPREVSFQAVVLMSRCALRAYFLYTQTQIDGTATAGFDTGSTAATSPIIYKQLFSNTASTSTWNTTSNLMTPGVWGYRVRDRIAPDVGGGRGQSATQTECPTLSHSMIQTETQSANRTDTATVTVTHTATSKTPNPIPTHSISELTSMTVTSTKISSASRSRTSKTRKLPRTKSVSTVETKTRQLTDTRTRPLTDTRTHKLPQTKSLPFTDTKTRALSDSKTRKLPRTKSVSNAETVTRPLPDTRTPPLPLTKSLSAAETKTRPLTDTRTHNLPRTRTVTHTETPQVLACRAFTAALCPAVRCGLAGDVCFNSNCPTSVECSGLGCALSGSSCVDPVTLALPCSSFSPSTCPQRCMVAIVGASTACIDTGSVSPGSCVGLPQGLCNASPLCRYVNGGCVDVPCENISSAALCGVAFPRCFVLGGQCAVFCPASAPVQCASGSCAVTAAHCTQCASPQLLCWDTSCAWSLTDCPCHPLTPVRCARDLRRLWDDLRYRPDSLR